MLCCNVFVVLYTVRIVFMTGCTYCCICDTLVGPWIVCLSVCVCVCREGGGMYVCMYACNYVVSKEQTARASHSARYLINRFVLLCDKEAQ
jgi:hypothetical protein